MRAEVSSGRRRQPATDAQTARRAPGAATHAQAAIERSRTFRNRLVAAVIADGAQSLAFALQPRNIAPFCTGLEGIVGGNLFLIVLTGFRSGAGSALIFCPGFTRWRCGGTRNQFRRGIAGINQHPLRPRVSTVVMAAIRADTFERGSGRTSSGDWTWRIDTGTGRG